MKRAVISSALFCIVGPWVSLVLAIPPTSSQPVPASGSQDSTPLSTSAQPAPTSSPPESTPRSKEDDCD